MTGSTFTISNVGPLGGSIGATPIINYPEVALMAFHKTKNVLLSWKTMKSQCAQ